MRFVVRLPLDVPGVVELEQSTGAWGFGGLSGGQSKTFTRPLRAVFRVVVIFASAGKFPDLAPRVLRRVNRDLLIKLVASELCDYCDAFRLSLQISRPQCNLCAPI